MYMPNCRLLEIRRVRTAGGTDFENFEVGAGHFVRLWGSFGSVDQRRGGVMMMLKIHRMRGGDSSAIRLIDKWARLGFATSRHHMRSTQPALDCCFSHMLQEHL
jgi:hypothetical protein